MPRNPDKKDYSRGLLVGFDKFIIIEDPRIGGNKKYHFGEILFIAVRALVCGVSSFSGTVEFVHIHEVWRRKRIRLPNGIPVNKRLSTFFRLWMVNNLASVCCERIKDPYSASRKQLIAIDEKSIRGSGKSNSERQHGLSAWAADAGVAPAPEFVDKKSNEIPSISILLDKLEPKEHVVSMDAMGTQRVMVIDFEYVPASRISFEQACHCDYYRVSDDLLRPQREGKEIAGNREKFIGILQREAPAIHAGECSSILSNFPNIMRNAEVCRALASDEP